MTIYFKGFDNDLKCRDFQYEVGETYETDKAVICKSGFHACKHPLDVLTYYPYINGNRYCVVELGIVEIDESEKDSKVCSKKITITKEITYQELCSYLFGEDKVEDYSHSSTAGNKSHSSAAGDWSHSSTAGNQSHSSTAGRRSHSSTAGDSSHSSTAGRSSNSSTAGYSSNSSTAGDWSHSICAGHYSISSTAGKNCVSVALGKSSKAKAAKGSWIVLVQYNKYNDIVDVKSVLVDGDIIKADTYYSLVNGEFVCD